MGSNFAGCEKPMKEIWFWILDKSVVQRRANSTQNLSFSDRGARTSFISPSTDRGVLNLHMRKVLIHEK